MSIKDEEVFVFNFYTVIKIRFSVSSLGLKSRSQFGGAELGADGL